MSVTDTLSTLVQTLVPDTRRDAALLENLVLRCNDILNQRSPTTQDEKAITVAELIQSHAADTLPTFEPLHRPEEAPPHIREPLLSDLTIGGANLRAAKSVPRARMLKEHYDRSGTSRVAEHTILKDCLYILQGISGKLVAFVGDEDQDERRITFRDNSNGTIPQPTRLLIHRLSEVGHLYTRVAQFVQTVGSRPRAGMIEQSLCHHLQQQLTEYYRLVAILESHVIPSDDMTLPTMTQAIEPILTLRRLDVLVDQWRLRLRMMSICVEACKVEQGGALVSLIHSYTDNGDPFIRQFTDSLLDDVSQPFFATLRQWLFYGELIDPFSEFFVCLNPDISVKNTNRSGTSATSLTDPHERAYLSVREDELAQSDHDGGRVLWQEKYQFRSEMLPGFVEETFGRKIFSTGKSLNFIRYSCQDADWVATRKELGKVGGSLRYSDIAGLEQSIDNAYQVASQRLLNVFFEKFRLLDHLSALKHYMMLGYGDFADQLMEALGPNLSRPANTLYRHTLTAILESSIRASNARNDSPEVLRRLDARMLEYSHGEIGWDVFTLEYRVGPPIDTILDPVTMAAYMKVFNHLWKLKRIEGALTRGWMMLAGGSRTVLRVADLESQWHHIRLAIAEMIHFIRQYQAWCQLEVIECSWKQFLEFVNRQEGDLDALTNAHQVYLDQILSKIFLRSAKAGKEDILLLQVQDIFQLVLQFRDAMDNFYNLTLAEAARQDTRHDRARGVVTLLNQPTSSVSDNVVRAIRGVHGYAASFSEKAQAIVHGLQSHTDPDCRFLAIRLSFSDYYRSKSRVSQ